MLKKHGASAIAILAIASASVLTSCTEVPQNASVQKGAVPLTAVRVGTAEQVFKDAIMTFAPDPKGSMDGKTQYLSRATDDNGGQYVVQAKNDECFGVDVIHSAKPVDKNTALQTMKNLLPPEIVAENQPTLVGTQTNAQPVETYKFGDKYQGQLIYQDKNADKVTVISASRVATVQ